MPFECVGQISRAATVSGVSKQVSHALCSPLSLNSFHLNALLKGQLTLSPAHTPAANDAYRIIFCSQCLLSEDGRVSFSVQGDELEKVYKSHFY